MFQGKTHRPFELIVALHLDWKSFHQWQRHPNVLERDYQFKRAMGFPLKHSRVSMDCCPPVGPPGTQIRLEQAARRLTGSKWNRGHPAKPPQYGRGPRPCSEGVL